MMMNMCCFAVEQLLLSQNHHVTAVDSAQKALDKVFSGSRFDLLVMDVSMPGQSGPEVAAELFELFPEQPVLLISGFSENSIGDDLMKRRNLGFLAKPFSNEQLSRAIKNLLNAATVNSISN